MQGMPWINVIQRLPVEVQGQLMLSTRAGMEIRLQSILSIQTDCLIFKGRMAGSQDTGRIFFVPFDQIDFISSVNPLPEDDIRGWFESPEIPVVANDQTAANREEASEGKNQGVKRLNERQAVLLDRVRARAKSSE